MQFSAGKIPDSFFYLFWQHLPSSSAEGKKMRKNENTKQQTSLNIKHKNVFRFVVQHISSLTYCRFFPTIFTQTRTRTPKDTFWKLKHNENSPVEQHNNMLNFLDKHLDSWVTGDDMLFYRNH